MSPRERIERNPFYVLGLRPGATRAAIEEEAQKLLGMLALELAGASVYATPLGPRPRTADEVRVAVAELRDPERRAAHEVWARLEPSSASAAPAPEGWPAAFAAFGVGR
jgi:hypothetical protein